MPDYAADKATTPVNPRVSTPYRHAAATRPDR